MIEENLVVLPSVKTEDDKLVVWGLNNDVVILDKHQIFVIYLELHKFLKEEQDKLLSIMTG